MKNFLVTIGMKGCGTSLDQVQEIQKRLQEVIASRENSKNFDVYTWNLLESGEAYDVMYSIIVSNLEERDKWNLFADLSLFFRENEDLAKCVIHFSGTAHDYEPTGEINVPESKRKPNSRKRN